MNCIKCGEEINIQDKFCMQCGSKVEVKTKQQNINKKKEIKQKEKLNIEVVIPFVVCVITLVLAFFPWPKEWGIGTSFPVRLAITIGSLIVMVMVNTIKQQRLSKNEAQEKIVKFM